MTVSRWLLALCRANRPPAANGYPSLAAGGSSRPAVLHAIATGGEAPGQFLHQLGIDQFHFVRHFSICRDRDRVFQHDEWQLRIIQGLLLCPGHSKKCLGDDAHGRNTTLLKIDRILETPGGTTASFSDPGDDGISLGHEGFEHLVSRGAGEERFLRIDNGLDTRALLQ